MLQFNAVRTGISLVNDRCKNYRELFASHLESQTGASHKLTMQHLIYGSLAWMKTSAQGVTKADVAMNSEGGGLSFWRVPKGAGFSHHGHKGYEYIYIVRGSMDFSGVRMEAGDFLLTSEGEEHEAVALEESEILVVNERKNS